MKSFNIIGFLTFLICVAMFGCKEKQSKSVLQSDPSTINSTNETFKTVTLDSAAILLNGKRWGAATVVNDKRGNEYIISARHVFEPGGVFTVTMNTETLEVYAYVTDISGPESVDLVIGTLSKKSQQLPALEKGAYKSRMIDTVNNGGKLHFALFQEKRTLLVKDEEVDTLGRWVNFNKGYILDIIDYNASPGWSGTGIVDKAGEIFYVITGGLPDEVREALGDNIHPKTQGTLTMITGMTWKEIQQIHSNLKSRK